MQVAPGRSLRSPSRVLSRCATGELSEMADRLACSNAAITEAGIFYA